jgi:hypothetical protein
MKAADILRPTAAGTMTCVAVKRVLEMALKQGRQKNVRG